MKIQMLKTMEGSNDGILISRYDEGQEYSCPLAISEFLATVFLQQGWAREIKDVVVETKVIKDVETKEEPKLETKTPTKKAK
jgi:hypothetical protein